MIERPRVDRIAAAALLLLGFALARPAVAEVNLVPDGQPVITAAVNNDLPGLRRMLTGGGPVNQSDPDGRTPLAIAAQTGNVEMTRLLLEFSAKVNYRENRFGNTPLGWPRVQAICDFVHSHVRFGYQHARATKTAWEAFNEGKGVCRDYAHLAITFCRAMNIPARYCTGYLGDIGVPPDDAQMDFSAWFEVYLGGRWYTFDARHNKPRIGRILMARGRDATDVAIVTSFGPCTLASFKVITDEVTSAARVGR